MMARWFFSLDDDDVIYLQAGETVDDAREECTKGQSFYGISYEAMRDAVSGAIDVDENGVGKFIDIDKVVNSHAVGR